MAVRVDGDAGRTRPGGANTRRSEAAVLRLAVCCLLVVLLPACNPDSFSVFDVNSGQLLIGRVVGPDGAVEDAEITVWDAARGGLGGLRMTSFTDADGAYQVPIMPGRPSWLPSLLYAVM